MRWIFLKQSNAILLTDEATASHWGSFPVFKSYIRKQSFLKIYALSKEIARQSNKSQNVMRANLFWPISSRLSKMGVAVRGWWRHNNMMSRPHSGIFPVLSALPPALENEIENWHRKKIGRQNYSKSKLPFSCWVLFRISRPFLRKIINKKVMAIWSWLFPMNLLRFQFSFFFQKEN